MLEHTSTLPRADIDGWKKRLAPLIAIALSAMALMSAAKADGLDGWRVGTWASPTLANPGAAKGIPTNTLDTGAFSLRGKDRGPAAWTLLNDDQLELLTVRPWASGGAGGGFASGLLVDIPVGAFTFTPSLGAMSTSGFAGDGALGGATITLRSQIELGYRADGGSEIVLGLGRMTPLSGGGAREENDVVSLTYRLPFTSLPFLD